MHKNRLLNLSGLLLSFGAALGGLLLVQNRLAREEADLLRSGGVIRTAARSEDAEAESPGETEIARTRLTEAQLIEVVELLEHSSEIYPHEPKQGQLSMAEAIECGKNWLEDFCIPHFENSASSSREYRANCYLWSPLEEEGDGNDILSSFWSMHLSSQGIDAVLILNAVSGQVLNASVSCSSPLECQNDGEPLTFLQDYADSFGLEASELILSQKEGPLTENGMTLYQNIGKEGTFAAIRTESFVIGSVDPLSDLAEYTEIFNLHLYLTNMPLTDDPAGE